jgi:hypothetical protein
MKKKHTRARDAPASRARLVFVAPAGSAAAVATPPAAPATPATAAAARAPSRGMIVVVEVVTWQSGDVARWRCHGRWLKLVSM